MEDEILAVVIDNGSSSIKAGMAGDDAPRCDFPAAVMQGHKEVGRDAWSRRQMIDVEYPIKQSIVQNWDDVERLWHHTLFEELRIVPEDHPIMMTEAPLNPKSHRERMTRIMFEKFNVPCFYISQSAVSSLYASGKTTGVVIDAGDAVTHTVPIFEGFAIPSAIQRFNLAGQNVTQYLQELLKLKQFYFQTPTELDALKDIKEKMCYVVPNYEQAIKESEISQAQIKSYDLPDGRKIQLGEERFKATEILLQPDLAGIEMEGIDKICFDSVQKCDYEFRKELLLNVILSGGSTLFEGFAERLWQSMNGQSPSSHKVKVFAPNERKYTSWIGASILSSLSTFQTMWITKSEYDESGPNIVNRKCF